MEKDLPRICFVVLDAYPILKKRDLGYTGGEEKSQALIGQGLADKGLNTTFITYAHSDSECLSEEQVGNIRIIKAYNRARKMNLIARFAWLWKAYRKADADTYLHSGNISLCFYCILNRKKYILLIASDPAAMGRDTEHPTFLNTFSAKLNIKLASQVIARNEWQQETLRKYLKKESVLIKHPIPVTLHPSPGEPTGKSILWVATIRPVKRPRLFLQLARLLPQYQFRMIGGPVEKEHKLYQDMEKQANDIDNLEFVGFVPPFEMDEHYQQASLLINTSSAEGFPMTFLEAWAHGLPVATLGIDPDGLIVRNRLGFTTSSIEEMAEKITALMEDEKTRQEMAEQARNYILTEHDTDKIASQYLEIINALAKK